MTQIDFRQELTSNKQQLFYMYTLLQNQNAFNEQYKLVQPFDIKNYEFSFTLFKGK